MGECWVDGAVPDKSLFNASIIIAKAVYDIVSMRENFDYLRVFVAGDSTIC